MFIRLCMIGISRIVVHKLKTLETTFGNVNSNIRKLSLPSASLILLPFPSLK